MFVYNTFKPDYRVLKEAKTLQDSGYKVVVVAFRTNNIVSRETIEGVDVIRIDLFPFYKKYHPRFFMKKSPFAGEEKPSQGQMDSSNIKQQPVATKEKRKPSRLQFYKRKWNYGDFYTKALKLKEVRKADIYHCHDLNTLPLGIKARKRFGGKVVYDSHELFTEIGLLEEKEAKRFKRIEGKLIKKVDEVITVNPSIAGELVKRYGIEEPDVLMNCPPKPKNIEWDRSRLRTYAKVKSDLPIILYQGGYGPNRGLEELIESMTFVDNGVLVMMGWGKIEMQLREIARENNLEEKVHFVPGVEQHELLGMTHGADVGVIPYKPIGLNNYYTSPNKLFEYMNAGVPIAGSDVPELRRFLVEMGTGMVFDPQKPEDMGKVLKSMLEDKDRLDQFRNRTKEMAEVYNWEEESKKLVDIYSRLDENSK